MESESEGQHDLLLFGVWPLARGPVGSLRVPAVVSTTPQIYVFQLSLYERHTTACTQVLEKPKNGG